MLCCFFRCDVLCSAVFCYAVMCFAMLCVWFDEPETIVPHFPTGFSMEFPYDPQELIIFTLVGVVCGFGGALYVFTHRKYVLWMRGNKRLTSLLHLN